MYLGSLFFEGWYVSGVGPLFWDEVEGRLGFRALGDSVFFWGGRYRTSPQLVRARSGLGVYGGSAQSKEPPRDRKGCWVWGVALNPKP